MHEQMKVPRNRNASSSTISHGANKSSRLRPILMSPRMPLKTSVRIAKRTHRRESDQISQTLSRIHRLRLVISSLKEYRRNTLPESKPLRLAISQPTASSRQTPQVTMMNSERMRAKARQRQMVPSAGRRQLSNALQGRKRTNGKPFQNHQPLLADHGEGRALGR